MNNDSFLDDRLENIMNKVCQYMRQPITLQQHRDNSIDVMGYCSVLGETCLMKQTNELYCNKCYIGKELEVKHA